MSTTVGLISSITDPTLIEILGAEGLDFYVLDLEHGLVGDDDCDLFIRACLASSVVPFARVPPTEPERMTRLLDAGMKGLVIPRIEKAAEVEHVLREILFPPRGRRGMGMTRVSRHGRIKTDAEFLHRLEDALTLTVQIETESAVNDLAAITALKRIDALVVGARDLSMSLGVAGAYEDPLVVSAIDRVRGKARTGGMAFGALARSPEHSAELRETGPVFMLLGLPQVLQHGIRPYLSREQHERAAVPA